MQLVCAEHSYVLLKDLNLNHLTVISELKDIQNPPSEMNTDNEYLQLKLKYIIKKLMCLTITAERLNGLLLH